MRLIGQFCVLAAIVIPAACTPSDDTPTDGAGGDSSEPSNGGTHAAGTAGIGIGQGGRTSGGAGASGSSSTVLAVAGASIGTGGNDAGGTQATGGSATQAGNIGVATGGADQTSTTQISIGGSVTNTAGGGIGTGGLIVVGSSSVAGATSVASGIAGSIGVAGSGEVAGAMPVGGNTGNTSIGGAATGGAGIAGMSGAAGAAGAAASTACPDGYWGPDCSRCVVHVDGVKGSVTNDGRSWQSAQISLQQGLDLAQARTLLEHLSTCDVWVAAGTYEPSVNTTEFTLGSKVGLYGGFNGTEVDREQRDWVNNRTTLKGQLVTNNASSNADTPVLDGFDATASIRSIYVRQWQVANCRFTGSGVAITSNGGALVVNNSEFRNDGLAISGTVGITVNKCMFANQGLGVSLNSSGYTVTVNDSSFNGTTGAISVGAGNIKVNRSTFQGMRGVSVFRLPDGHTEIADSAFLDNEAPSATILDINYGAATVTNSLFWHNVATTRGGCFVVTSAPANLTIGGSTFSGNSAPDGTGGVAYVNGTFAKLAIGRSILWGNGASAIVANIVSNVTVTNSIVEGGYSGTGIIDADPLFVNPSTGDLHLQSGSPGIGMGYTYPTP